MLRAYAIPSKTIGDSPLTSDEEAALAYLIEAISTRVTFVLTRSELSALVRAIERVSSEFNRERLRARLAQDLANGGPGLCIVDQSMKFGTRSRLVRGLLDSGRVDAVLDGVGGRGRRAAAKAANACLGIIEAAREIQSMPIEHGLCAVSGEDELASIFRPLFRFGEDLIIIDPYLAAEVLRALHGMAWKSDGLRFVVNTMAQTAMAQGGSLRIEAICSRRHLNSEFSKLRKQGKGQVARAACLSTKDLAVTEVVRFLQAQIVESAIGMGINADRIHVEVRWIPATSDRGFISSRRVWRIDHSLQTLTELLVKIRKGQRMPGNSARLQLLQDAGAAEIRRIALEAVPTPSRL